jgi:phage terminase large subunit
MTRGVTLAFMLINEVTLIDEKTYMAARARTRLKEAKLLQLAMSGSPEGFTWHYDYFIENKRDDTTLIFGSSRDNTFLHDSYVGMLEQSYDELMREQFIDGKFINMNGRAALWKFNRFSHVVQDIKQDDNLKKWVSLDFNVGNMAATIWQRCSIDSPYLLEAIDEIALTHDGADTYDVGIAIKERVGLDVTIYPDPAGNAGSTKGKSDIQILNELGFKDIKFKKKIVSVMDCLNSSNALLAKNKIRVSSKCKNFISDAEQCILKSNGTEIDKSNPKRSHWLDGFKNMIEYEFPIVKPNNIVKVTKYA